MIFLATLLIMVKIVSVEVMVFPASNCDFSVSVLPHQVYGFNNPHFPGTYTAGVTCRWIFDCPEYTCRVQCRDVGLPKTQGCFMDRLLVSITGNLFFEGAEVFCGRTSINTTSVGTRITIGLMSRAMSPGGRFRCTVRTEPFQHPWAKFAHSPNEIISDEKRR
ncbi:unnamed protein product [Arctia plantaginis]|uniref:CUB domain-containing protein n=1 Tax=Arctia plantaginis TaxID=874455 RepID=A0A8S1AZB2_ARCPL|nr:unnamed protein product [Arctia plantaginis]